MWEKLCFLKPSQMETRLSVSRLSMSSLPHFRELVAYSLVGMCPTLGTYGNSGKYHTTTDIPLVSKNEIFRRHLHPNSSIGASASNS